MEYDSRPKIKLFSIADREEETKELFFTGRKAMVIVGSIAGIVITGGIFAFTHHFFTALIFGAVVGIPMAVIPVLTDKSREAYFTPLIEKIIELLQSFEVEISKEQVMNLLSFKEVRINNEHVILVSTREGQLSIYAATDVLPEKIKKKKEKTFPVVVTENAENEVNVTLHEPPHQATEVTEEAEQDTTPSKPETRIDEEAPKE